MASSKEHHSLDQSSIDILLHEKYWPMGFILSDKFLSLIELIPEAVVISNQTGGIVQCNQTACDFFGFSRAAFLKLNIEDLVPERFRGFHPKLRESFFDDPKPRFLGRRSKKLFALKKSGEEKPMDAALFALETDQGPLAINLIRDTSYQTAVETELKDQAMNDSLTQLPNKRYFDQALKLAFNQAQRGEIKLTLLYADLDKFKPVNDTLGHEVGDRLLIQVAGRLTACLRKGDLVARLGGDEFGLLVFEPKNKPSIGKAVAERIIEELSKPYLIGNKEVNISVSIGYATVDASIRTPEELLALCDEAMYTAKENGGQQHHSHQQSQ